jgi:DNA-binding MarR family transcriptional regulator
MLTVTMGRRHAETAAAVRDSVDRELAAWLAELPGVDGQIEAVRMRVLRLGRQLERSLAATARAHGITLGDWETLSALRRAGPPYVVSPGRLARDLGVTSGTMSVRLDRLLHAGLIHPVTRGTDGREKPVRLTPAGYRTWRTATDARTRREAAVIGGALSGTALLALNDLLRRLMQRFESRFGVAPPRGALRRVTADRVAGARRRVERSRAHARQRR